MVKNLPSKAEDIKDSGLIPGPGRSIPWRKAWQPTPVFLPRESYIQRTPAGGLESTGSQRVGCNLSNLKHTHTHTRAKWTLFCARFVPENTQPQELMSCYVVMGMEEDCKMEQH